MTPALPWVLPGRSTAVMSCAGLPVEEQQRVIHVLPVVAMIGTPFLLPMGPIIRPIQIEDDVGRDAVPLPLAQIQLPQRYRQTVAALPIDRVLEARQSRLTGQISSRSPAAARRPASAVDRCAACRHHPDLRSHRRSERPADGPRFLGCGAPDRAATRECSPQTPHTAPTASRPAPTRASRRPRSGGLRQSSPPAATAWGPESGIGVWQTEACGHLRGVGQVSTVPIPKRCPAVTCHPHE